jgi:1,4-alpha-glucan branching enzyme
MCWAPASLLLRDRLRVLLACVLLTPAVPMLFMGEEWGTEAPFLYFCDFAPALARAVDAGRRRALARLTPYPDALVRPDRANPNDAAMFHACKLDWSQLGRRRNA